MEKQPQYVTDALEMAGIDLSAPKKIIQEMSGFTPIFDVVADALGNVTASVHGLAWRFCQMEDGVCKASLSTMGKLLNLDESTISRHMKMLVESGYFIDLTPDVRNRPHVYADTGKVIMRSKISARLADSKPSVADSKVTVAESRLNKDIKRDSKENATRSIVNDANKEVDYILKITLSPKAIQDAVAKFFLLTPNWEGNKFNRQWMQWAMENDVTPAQVEFAANLWRSDKRFNWQPPSLKGIQEHWLELRGDKASQSRDIETDSTGAPITW